MDPRLREPSSRAVRGKTQPSPPASKGYTLRAVWIGRHKQPPLCPLGVLPFEALPPAAVEPTSRLLLSRASSSREGRRAPQSVTRQQVGFRPKPTRPANLERPVRLASSNRTGPYEVLHLAPFRPSLPPTPHKCRFGNRKCRSGRANEQASQKPSARRPPTLTQLLFSHAASHDKQPCSRRDQLQKESCLPRDKCFRRNKRSRKSQLPAT
jgi:hypothetical protein